MTRLRHKVSWNWSTRFFALLAFFSFSSDCFILYEITLHYSLKFMRLDYYSSTDAKVTMNHPHPCV